MHFQQSADKLHLTLLSGSSAFLVAWGFPSLAVRGAETYAAFRHARDRVVPILDYGSGTPAMVFEDQFESTEILVTRQILVEDKGSRALLRGSITNTSGSDLHLGDWLLLETGAGTCPLFRAGDWRLLVHPRDKQAHPLVIPAGADDAFLFEVLDESGGITCDPFAILHRADNPGCNWLFAFTSECEHFGLIRARIGANRMSIESFSVIAEFDNCRLAPGETRSTCWILLDAEPDAIQSLDDYADLIRATHSIPTPHRPKTVYCTWYFYKSALTPAWLNEEMDWFVERNWPVDVIQIDDGWQRHWGEWVPDGDWTEREMIHAATRIRGSGREAGIWTAPFLAAPQSAVAGEHPEWFLKDSAGVPIRFRMGGQDNYILDPTADGVAAWFTEVYQRLQSWGFQYHKLDFMRVVGLSKDAIFADPGITRAEAYRRGLAAIRAALGGEGYILACGGFYLPGLGLADAQRATSDVSGAWREPYTWTRIRQNLLRNWQNRLWHKDPDALMLRRREEPFAGSGLSVGKHTDEEARLLTVCQYLGGGLTCLSERMPELDADREALYRSVIPPLGVAARPLDLFGGEPLPSRWLTEVTPRAEGLEPWWTLALLHVGEGDRVFDWRLDDSLGIQAPSDSSVRYLVWDYFEQRLRGVHRWGEACTPVTVPAHGARVLRVARWDGASLQLLATDGHFSMGGDEITAWAMGERGLELKVSSLWPRPLTLWLIRPMDAEPGYEILKQTVHP